MASSPTVILNWHRTMRRYCSSGSSRIVSLAANICIWTVHWRRYSNRVHGSIRQRTVLNLSRCRRVFQTRRRWTHWCNIGLLVGCTVTFHLQGNQSPEREFSLFLVGRNRWPARSSIWDRRERQASTMSNHWRIASESRTRHAAQSRPS